ncbi:probable aquaporin NIP5-1 [Physcomitrium patens]|uniref:Uncharacterized protein n=1 Tax=Physcomitrium patens TaxID=3218 RepID=A9S223_PHYPA|nr:hypothetical protein PHYPA_010097 [Physcomitrium patens]
MHSAHDDENLKITHSCSLSQFQCGELAEIAVGSAVALCALMAGSISGATSLGPAIASGNYHSLWVYMTGPTNGALMGMLAYAYQSRQCNAPATNQRKFSAV